jgi:hypothetical protein
MRDKRGGLGYYHPGELRLRHGGAAGHADPIQRGHRERRNQQRLQLWLRPGREPHQRHHQRRHGDVQLQRR